MNRLEAAYPEIAKKLKSLSSEQAAELSLNVSELALKTNGVDADELIAKHDIDGLHALSQSTENQYLDALSNDVDIDSHPELMALFFHARSLDSAAAALDGQNEDAIYEALHANITPEQIEALLTS